MLQSPSQAVAASIRMPQTGPECGLRQQPLAATELHRCSLRDCYWKSVCITTCGSLPCTSSSSMTCTRQGAAPCHHMSCWPIAADMHMVETTNGHPVGVDTRPRCAVFALCSA